MSAKKQSGGGQAVVGRDARTRIPEPEYVEPPRPVVVAALLMYAGAALTALGVIADVVSVVAGPVTRAGHHVTAHQAHATRGALITTIVFSGLLEVVLWVFLARANRAGLPWARIIASVLAAISTVIMVTTWLGSGSVTQKAFVMLTWLVGVAVVFFLWQPDSGAYFRMPSAPTSKAGRPASGGTAG